MNNIIKMPSWLYTLDWKPITKYSGKIPDNFTGIHYSKDCIAFYRLNGLRHRLDGPAVEHTNKTHLLYMRNIYYIKGQKIDNINSNESFLLYVDLLRLKGLL